MRNGRTYALYLSLKLKTMIYNKEELEKQLFMVSNTKYVDRLNDFFKNDNCKFRLKIYKDNYYRLESIE